MPPPAARSLVRAQKRSRVASHQKSVVRSGEGSPQLDDDHLGWWVMLGPPRPNNTRVISGHLQLEDLEHLVPLANGAIVGAIVATVQTSTYTCGNYIHAHLHGRFLKQMHIHVFQTQISHRL